MARGGKKAGGRGQPDLEAIGLVLLAFGVFVLGFLIPAVPTGDLGRQLRELVTVRVGLAAYALPWPPLVLGVFFLMRRNPRPWPRVFLGYLTFVIGLWGLLMLAAPASSGAWGVALRGTLTGVAGVLAYAPALLLVTFGVEWVLALPPTLIVRRTLTALFSAIRTTFEAAVTARNRARERAGFYADVALARKDLRNVDRDLVALSKLYPGSAELERWRNALRATVDKLGAADPGRLKEAQGDCKAWKGAVRDFARDRAAELATEFRAEGARAPAGGEGDAADVAAWAKRLKPLLEDPFSQPLGVAAELDRLRKTLDLDLTALAERQRRLARQRDLAEAALKKMGPRELVRASDAHNKRLSAYLQIEEDAAVLDRSALLLEPWHGLSDKLLRTKSEFPDDPELDDFDGALAADLKRRGRLALEVHASWGDALDAVEMRVRQRALAPHKTVVEEEPVAVGSAAAPSSPRPQVAVPTSAEIAASRLSGMIRGSPAVPSLIEPPAAVGSDLEELYDDPFARYAEAEAELEGYPGEGGRSPFPSAGQEPLPEVEVQPAAAAPSGVASEPAPGDSATAARRATAPAPQPQRDAKPEPEVPEVGGIPIQIPGLDLLDGQVEHHEDPGYVAREVQSRVRKIDETLSNFKLEGRVVSSVRGPSVTRFEVEPAPGEKISRFANLSDDLALAMAVGSVRIEAPIPGKSVIGLEVPNARRDLIKFREAAEAGSFRRSRARLPLILGKSIDGEMIVGDLAKMPHLLIAGSTGSGKSVAVNTLIGSLLYKFLPTELRFLMIDPKMVELTPFDGIPHLVRPVVTNPNDAAGVLLGAVAHMERRYKMMSKIGAKNLDQYNQKARNLDMPQLPLIVIVIDELADLMITSPKEVESAIMRLAQMSRATGMNLVLATQRPSVDILTSLIKVNVPARIAFAVSSGHDSRTILDTMGAERLIGMGDMLFYQPGLVKPVRLQGPFISEREIADLAAFMRRQYFDDDFVEAYASDFDPPSMHASDADGLIDWNDDKLRPAAELVIGEGQGSVSRLQRRLQVGHARAGKLMDSLEALGIVGPNVGSKPREVIVAYEDLPDIFGK